MGQAALDIGHASQKIEKISPDASHRKRREPPLVVHGQSAGRLFERDLSTHSITMTESSPTRPRP